MSSTVGPVACLPGLLPMLASTLPQVARWGDGDDEGGAAVVHRRPVGWPRGGAGHTPDGARCAPLPPRWADVGPSHRGKRNVTHQRAGRHLPARAPGHHAARRRPCRSHASMPITPPNNGPIGRAKEFGRRNGMPGELLVRVPMEKVLAYNGVAG